MPHRRITTVTGALVVMLALASAGPAAATTYRVSGRQIAVDTDKGIFRMTGSLVGNWTVTAFNPTATSPLVEANGSEVFSGCVDLGRNGCDRRDPKGTLNFTFTYQALFASPDPNSVVWGSCRHPIVSGTGDFAGAKGVIAMVDTPTPEGPRTDYIGNVTVPGKGRSHDGGHARAANAAATC